MTMRGWLLLATALAAADVGCSDAKTDAVPPVPSDSWGPRAGGINEDIGNYLPCEREERFELDSQTPLGFSARELLAYIEGRYRIPISWSDPCSSEDNACVRPRSCDSAGPRSTLSVAGTDTFMTLEVRATGAAARTGFPGEDQSKCGGSMRVPVEVSMESDDGAFSLQFAGEVWSENGRQAQVLSDDLLSEASGPLLSELPAGTRLDLGFGGGEKDYWYFGVSFINSNSSLPLLEGAVTGSCVGEGPRSEFVLP